MISKLNGIVDGSALYWPLIADPCILINGRKLLTFTYFADKMPDEYFRKSFYSTKTPLHILQQALLRDHTACKHRVIKQLEACIDSLN